MLLDNDELELLKLCAIARYLPYDSPIIYDLPMMRRGMFNTLVKNGYMKIVKGSRRFYRLTRRGRDLLMRVGYDFPDDTRPQKEGKVFDRRIINAGIDILLHGAGIDIYTKSVEGLKDGAYIPCLTLRSLKNKILAGTRFYGVVRIKDTAYVIYHAGGDSEGIFPEFEEETFTSLIRSADGIRYIAIIICGTMEGLLKTAVTDVIPKLSGGLISFPEIMRRWKYDFYLLPMNRDGVTQMKIMTLDNGGKEIASLFGDTDNVPITLNQFDALKGEKAYITATDLNITRMNRALEQILFTDYIPNIICLPNQRGIYQEMVIKNKYPKQMKFTVINRNKLSEQFPCLANNENKAQPARGKDGECITI